MHLLLRTQPALECDLTDVSVPSKYQVRSFLVRSGAVHIYLSMLESHLPQTFVGLVHAVSLCEFICAIKILFTNTCKEVPKAHSL